MEQEAEKPPQEAVMTAVPAPREETLPLASTDATPELEQDQLTPVCVALAGETVAESRREEPISRMAEVRERVSPVTAT